MVKMLKEARVKVCEQDIYSLLLEKQNNGYANNISHCFLSSALKRGKVFDEGWQLLIFTHSLCLIKKNGDSVLYRYSNPITFSDGIKDDLFNFDTEKYSSIKPFWMRVDLWLDTQGETVNHPFLERAEGYIYKEEEIGGR